MTENQHITKKLIEQLEEIKLRMYEVNNRCNFILQQKEMLQASSPKESDFSAKVSQIIGYKKSIKRDRVVSK